MYKRLVLWFGLDGFKLQLAYYAAYAVVVVFAGILTGNIMKSEFPETHEVLVGMSAGLYSTALCAGSMEIDRKGWGVRLPSTEMLFYVSNAMAIAGIAVFAVATDFDIEAKVLISVFLTGIAAWWISVCYFD